MWLHVAIPIPILVRRGDMAVQMIDWKLGGRTGSLNRYVRREIQEHFRQNAVARRCRYSLTMRLLHRIFDEASFSRFICMYFGIVIVVGIVEIILSTYNPLLLLQWTAKSDIKPFLANVAGYLIAAQVGVLGVVSIAIGLVTIIAQRENASSDVQIYYHEALAFGVVASSLALLAVLCIQLIWPIQFAIHLAGFGGSLQFYKIFLTTVHIAWLLINLSVIAHFVATTLAFAQQSARQTLRERYTTNVVLPIELRKRLRQQLYLAAGPDCVQQTWPAVGKDLPEPIVYFGSNFNDVGEIEIPHRHGPKSVLVDIRMRPARWVIVRWLRRCAKSQNQTNVERRTDSPVLLFPPRLDEAPLQKLGLCRMRGGVPLKVCERVALRLAFRFRRASNEA